MSSRYNYYFLLLVLFILIIPLTIVKASNKEEISLVKCIDGDTAKFNIEGKEKKVRFLAINTPESINKIEPYGKEASYFTCNLLTNAKIIKIEYDKNSNKLDKYNRTLGWIWVNDKLVQEEIIKEGLAEVKYLYGDYKYTQLLKDKQEIAKNNKIGIWSNATDKSDISQLLENKFFLITIATMIIIFYIFSSSFRKETTKKIKKKAKKEFNNKINKLLR